LHAFFLVPSASGETIVVMIVYDSTAKAKGRWAIKVSGNWRLTFDFKDGDALNVDVEDYH